MSVAVSVYMYPAGAPTKYSGAYQSGFIQAAGGAGYEAKVDYSIEPGRLPTGSTAGGLVTSTPADYEFRIALFANVPERMDPHQFVARIPVRVTGAGASTSARSRREQPIDLNVGAGARMGLQSVRGRSQGPSEDWLLVHE